MWITYSEQKPPVGIYEWRVPSRITPGQVVIVTAQMRMRNAGYQQEASPSFDWWDGYQLIVPPGTQWRATTKHAGLQSYQQTLVAVEGVTFCECIYCNTVPRLIGAQHSTYNSSHNPSPENYNAFKLECCSWAKTPWMSSAQALEDMRLRAFEEAARRTICQS